MATSRTEGNKDYMSQRKTKNKNEKHKTHCNCAPPPPLFKPPLNFKKLLKYFKYLYFNFYINIFLINVFYY
jgi:hypothetical protein